jgi:hypothetical protein
MNVSMNALIKVLIKALAYVVELPQVVRKHVHLIIRKLVEKRTPLPK